MIPIQVDEYLFEILFEAFKKQGLEGSYAHNLSVQFVDLLNNKKLVKVQYLDTIAKHFELAGKALIEASEKIQNKHNNQTETKVEFELNGIPYVECKDLPVIGDLFKTQTGRVIQATSLAHLEVLVDTDAMLIRPLRDKLGETITSKTPIHKEITDISPYVYPGLMI